MNNLRDRRARLERVITKLDGGGFHCGPAGFASRYGFWIYTDAACEMFAAELIGDWRFARRLYRKQQASPAQYIGRAA